MIKLPFFVEAFKRFAGLIEFLNTGYNGTPPAAATSLTTYSLQLEAAALGAMALGKSQSEFMACLMQDAPTFAKLCAPGGFHMEIDEFRGLLSWLHYISGRLLEDRPCKLSSQEVKPTEIVYFHSLTRFFALSLPKAYELRSKEIKEALQAGGLESAEELAKHAPTAASDSECPSEPSTPPPPSPEPSSGSV